MVMTITSFVTVKPMTLKQCKIFCNYSFKLPSHTMKSFHALQTRFFIALLGHTVLKCSEKALLKDKDKRFYGAE